MRLVWQKLRYGLNRRNIRKSTSIRESTSLTCTEQSKNNVDVGRVPRGLENEPSEQGSIEYSEYDCSRYRVYAVEFGIVEIRRRASKRRVHPVAGNVGGSKEDATLLRRL